jgi:3'-5' exoribonuclease
MSASKANLVPLAELPPGRQADFFAILLDRVRGTTREGRPYFHCRFGDARRTVSLMVWSDDRWYAKAEAEWRPGQFYKLRGVYSDHERYGPQIELMNLRPVREGDAADGFDPAALVEMSPCEPTLLLGELRALAEANIAIEAHRGLVLDLLEQHAEDLLRLPATRDRAYPYRGGLLEHTLAVATTAVDLAQRYAVRFNPPLDRDLVCAAAVLHDIGRVLELGDESPIPAVTIPGRLAGPHVLGRDLVRDAARERGDIDPEWLALLEHLILTPSSDRGHAKGPIIPEGLILQHADELDLEMSLFARCLERHAGPGPFTDRDPALGRRLLKRR